MEKLEFSKALKYPFNRWKGLLNILWLLIPVLGWFAIIGYQVKLVREWVEGKFEELPSFEFGKNLELGFVIFLKLIPLMLAVMAVGALLGRMRGLGSIIFVVFVLLTVPILAINLFVKGTVKASFDFDKLKAVFNNFGEYLGALVMDILLSFVFAILSIILIGIPAATFTKNIFLSDFYRRYVK